MGWYAFEEIGEALEEARDLLLPFDLRQWTKLAVIVLLTGSGFNLPTGGFGGPNAGGPSTDLGASQSTFTSDFASGTIQSAAQPAEFSSMMNSMAASSATMTVLAVILAVFIFVGLPLIFLSSVFEFILYRSLIDKDVRIVDYFSENLGRGLRYFAFRVIYAVLVLSTLAVIILLGMESSTLLVLLLLGFVPVLIVSAVFAGLTKDFILLRMMEEDEGLIEAWRSFWPTLHAEWKQVLVYLVTKFFLGIFVGAVSATAILAFTVMAAIPVIILAVLLSFIAEILFVIPVILGLLVWLVALIYIAVPFRVYLYYYVILVYHDLTS